MKSLKDFLLESIFDADDHFNGEEVVKAEIKAFLKDNYKGYQYCEISDAPNDDGKYIVSTEKSLSTKNTSISRLTNDLFIFGEVAGDFHCEYCSNLTSLEGAPKKVGGEFFCTNCGKLKTLQGSPKEVDGQFGCILCTGLTTLEGAPESVGQFSCVGCSLNSLEGAPKEVAGDFICDNSQLKSLKGSPEKIGGSFCCSYNSFTSLEGAPKRVLGDFWCYTVDRSISEKDVKKVTKVKGNIIVNQ